MKNKKEIMQYLGEYRSLTLSLLFKYRYHLFLALSKYFLHSCEAFLRCWPWESISSLLLLYSFPYCGLQRAYMRDPLFSFIFLGSFSSFLSFFLGSFSSQPSLFSIFGPRSISMGERVPFLTLKGVRWWGFSHLIFSFSLLFSLLSFLLLLFLSLLLTWQQESCEKDGGYLLEKMDKAMFGRINFFSFLQLWLDFGHVLVKLIGFFWA